MKLNNQNIIIDSINYLKIFVKESDKFNEFLHIGQATNDPLKVSYIKKEKIKSLKDFAKIEIGKYPSREFRNKYFVSTTIEKLFKELFTIVTNGESNMLYEVISRIDIHLKNNIKNELFIEKDVSGFYSEELKKYSYYKNGSCMSGKPRKFFKLYDLINEDKNLSVKIVGIKSEDLVIARALLFSKTIYKHKICENSGKIINTTSSKSYYLDRIYVADFLQNSSYEELQTKLFLQIKRAYKLHNLNCYNKSQIESELKEKHNIEKLNIYSKKHKPSFFLDVCPTDVEDLEFYPYADTFKYVADKGITCLDGQTGHILTLDCTDGEATEAEPQNECCDCGLQCDDEVYYSELENEYICNDCSVYIEERGESCLSDNAVYNSYSNVYHYSEDIS